MTHSGQTLICATVCLFIQQASVLSDGEGPGRGGGRVTMAKRIRGFNDPNFFTVLYNSKLLKSK
jgi:hypothetical protein